MATRNPNPPPAAEDRGGHPDPDPGFAELQRQARAVAAEQARTSEAQVAEQQRQDEARRNQASGIRLPPRSSEAERDAERERSAQKRGRTQAKRGR